MAWTNMANTVCKYSVAIGPLEANVPYQVFVHQVAVLERDLDGAELVVRRALQKRLGGLQGLVEADLAAPQLLTPSSAGQ